MKDVVLDTNVIITDPTILAQSRKDVRLLVPTVVLREAETFSSARKSRLADLIRRSAAARKVTIVSPSNLPIMIHGAPAGISYADTDVLSFALENKANNPDTVLATSDLELRIAATRNGLDVIDAAGLRKLFASQAPADIEILEDARSVARKVRTNGIINFTVGAATSLLAVILYDYRESIVPYLTSIAGVVAMAVAGLALFWVRSRWRLGYGVAEFVVGLIITYNAIASGAVNDQISAIEIIKLSSGLYVMVRGLDNFGKGLKGFPLEPKWKRVFPD